MIAASFCNMDDHALPHSYQGLGVSWVKICCAGDFELTANNREIWHGPGLAGAALLRANWNLFLLQVCMYTPPVESAKVFLHALSINNLLWCMQIHARPPLLFHTQHIPASSVPGTLK